MDTTDLPAQSLPAFLLPHMQQFQAVWQTPAKTYRFTFDEALKRSRVNALAMRRDGHILSLLQARYLPLLGAEWSVKTDDEQYKEQASTYQRLIEKTPRLLQLRKCLLEAVWYGRYGVQFAFGPVNVAGKQMTGITGWRPVNGDKINFTEEGVPTIRVNAAWASRLESEGATVGKVDASASWNDQGRVLVLDKPAYRQKFAIHIHEIEDADFSEPELAGGVGGVGLRHYCYWIWWLRQEIMEWLLSYLEIMGAGGLTIVGYDASNTKGLAEAQEAFSERATVVYLPIPPGQEKQTNIVQRIEPSGTGNDIFNGWIEGYFNAILTRIIIGQDLSSKSGPTGLGSGVADLQQEVKQCIHRYDAKNLNETETQQILDVLISLNEPNSDYGLRCETLLKSPEASAELDAAQKAFGLGAELPESHVRKLANIPEPKEGEKILSQSQQQLEQSMLGGQGASVQEAVQGMTLEEMRHHLTDQGIADDEQLHHIADMIDAGELEELDAEGGVQYLEPEEEPRTYAKEDWVEEQGEKGGKRWRNTKTGTVQYKEPGDKRAGPADAKEEPKKRGGDTRVGTLRKGLATQGAYQSLDRAMRGESNNTLQGEGVLKHVMDADKRMLKAQVISLAAQHGMQIDSNTTKTRALAFIEDRLRQHQGAGDGKGARELRDEGGKGERGTAGKLAKDTEGTGGSQQQADPPKQSKDDNQATEAGGNADKDMGGKRDVASTGATSQQSEPAQTGGEASPAPMQSSGDVFSSGIEKSDLTEKMRKQYSQTAKDVYAKLPAAAKERFDKHVESVSFHESPDVLTEKLKEANPKMTDVIGNKKAGGAYSKMRKELLLNGGHSMDGKKYTADQIYAHEYTHAIDGPDKELSSSPEWRDAWKSEAANVSKYAMKTPAEGFAEFGRMVYTGELGSDQLTERYPKMMAHWEQSGLLPDGMKQSAGTLAESGPQMTDVFEEPFETPEHLGDKALSRRGESESLKDYLTGIGGAGAYDDIDRYANQLYAEEQTGIDSHNDIVDHAMEALSWHHGKKLTIADIKRHAKDGDHSTFKGFDEVAGDVSNYFSGHFQAQSSDSEVDHSESYDNSEKLWDMLKEGKRANADPRQHEDRAVQEWHDAGRPMPEGYEPPEVSDTSFDFGENVDDNPFKRTPEEDREAWNKFAAKMKKEGGNSLIDVTHTQPKPLSESKGWDDLDPDDKFMQKMAAEAKKYAKSDAYDVMSKRLGMEDHHFPSLQRVNK